MHLKINFWDVGQGDCSVIELPKNRLFVIDTGPFNSQLPIWLDEWLKNAGASAKVTLLLTHDDCDHTGVAYDLITKTLGPHLDRLYCVLDHGPGSADKHRNLLGEAIDMAVARGVNYRLLGHQSPQDGPEDLYKGGSNGHSIRVRCHFPHSVALRRHAKRRHKEPNDVSAVVTLSVDGANLVTWGGDVRFRVVEQHCVGASHTLVGPHHGQPKDHTTKRILRHMDRYRPKQVWISTGTDNAHEHPSEHYLRAMAERGARIVCSQRHHCDRRPFASKAPSGFHYHHGAVGSLKPLGRCSPCRGAMQWTWNATSKRMEPDIFDSDHRALVASLDRALCRECGK